VARLEDVELVERLFLIGYPFSRFAPRTGDPVSTTMTPLKKPLESVYFAAARNYREDSSPRALFVPRPLGYPLGEPDNPNMQTRIMRAAFALLPRTDVPVLENF